MVSEGGQPGTFLPTKLVGVILRTASGRRPSNVLLTRPFFSMKGPVSSIDSMCTGNQKPGLASCVTQSHSTSSLEKAGPALIVALVLGTSWGHRQVPHTP